jgi:hypothetical protein
MSRRWMKRSTRRARSPAARTSTSGAPVRAA